MLLIKNGHILTMEDRDYENGYILIDQGKILKVGDMKDAPDVDARVIDAKGAIITPGFVDAHSHLGVWEDGIDFEGADGNEDTDPVTPQLRVLDGINPQDRAFLEAAESGITTVVVSPGSANPIGGQISAIKTRGVCIDDMLVEEFVGIKGALGENPKRSYDEKDQAPATRMGTASVIREALKKAKDYKEQLDKYERDKDNETKPEWDFKNHAFLSVINREKPIHFHAHRLDDIFTAIRIAKEFDIKIVIIHGTEAHLAPQRIAMEGVGILSGPILTDRSKPELKNQSEKAPYLLTKAGIEIALITDHPETPQKFLSLCAMTAMSGGMEYRDVLKALTIIPSRLCGIDNRVGSIKEGKDGDIIIWKGKPLEALAKPETVIIDGQE